MSNTLVIGDVTIDSSHIVSGDVALSHSMIGETLAADSLKVEIDLGMGASGGFYEGYIPRGESDPYYYETSDKGTYFVQYVPDDVSVLDISSISIGDEILCYDDGELIGKYYLEKLTRIGKTRYSLEGISQIGLLIKTNHYGGIYNSVLASTVFAEILDGVDYTLDSDLDDVYVTGYLPIATKRDNLQQLLFATGSAVYTSSEGILEIKAMDSTTAGTFSRDRCYTGGSVEYGESDWYVEVTEHNYFEGAGTEEETLYEGGVDGSITLQFDAPYYDLTCDGGTISASSANYVTITGSGHITLTGKPYTHIERVVSVGDSDSENTQTLTSATLANPEIAYALAERLYDYLCCSTIIKQDVLLGEEKTGEIVEVINPYTLETESAAITQMDITMSGTNKATGNFLVDFEPQGILTGYQHYAVLTSTSSTVWTVPDSATTGTIRVIIAGAGSGGTGGEAGGIGQTFETTHFDCDDRYRSEASGDPGIDDEEHTYGHYGGTGGTGGTAGTGGSGGMIYEATILAEAGDTFTYYCGTGGAGGSGGTAQTTEADAVSADEGSAGGESVFGERSSSWGVYYDNGYYEKNTGLTLCASGSSGYDGAAGGDGATYPDSDSAISSCSGDDGEDCGSYSGGTGGAADRVVTATSAESNMIETGGGGGGGGASYDANGGDGGDASYETGGAGGTGGDGGSGADGTVYGCGGGGGNGGGGGGGAGAALATDYSMIYDQTAEAGAAGIGGAGGSGGTGAQGVIIVYY